MSVDLPVHTIDTAPRDAKADLQDSLSKYKFVPNLHGVMAEAPALLRAYKEIGDLYAQTSMSVLERQVVLLTVNYLHDCHYCMAAHSMLATLEKMPPDVLNALRTGAPIADPKLEALRRFATAMADQRGWVSDADVAAFKAAGYTDQTILEVVLAVSYKVMSNYVNHIKDTPVDAPFANFAWSADDKPSAA